MQVGNKLLFFLPWYSEPHVREASAGIKQVHFLTRNLGWQLDGTPCNFAKTPPYDLLIHFRFVLKELKLSTPLFSRHYNFMPFQETIFRETVFAILSLAQVMRTQNFRIVYIGYKASHHLDALMVELAARVVDIPRVYETHIRNGLGIASIKRDGLSNTEAIDISEKSTFGLDLKNELLQGWDVPSAIGKNRPIDSFGIAVNRIVLNSIISNIRHLLRTGKAKDLFKYSYFKRHSLSTVLKILYRHKTALKTLNTFIQEDQLKIRQLLEKAPGASRVLVLYAHYQPEVTSYPLGGEYHNFIDIVMELRSTGFKDAIIFKEHPASYFYSMPDRKVSFAGVERSPEFYSILRKLNCLFIDQETTIPEEHILAITITGSIAIQRAIKGHPSIVLGEAWFDQIEGLYKELQLVPKLLSNEYTSPSHSGLKEFIEDVIRHKLFILPSKFNQSSWRQEQFRKYFLKLIEKLSTISV